MKISFTSVAGGLVVLLFLPVLLVGCRVPSQADAPARVVIDELSVQTLESFPVQVEVAIQGSLPDSCTSIEGVNQRFEAETSIFWIEIPTARTSGDACAQALVPFEETIMLDVMGLSAGNYTVDAHGTRQSFTLATDNVLPDDAELPNPASAYCVDQGYALEVRSDDQGNQYGMCIFPDGSECEEWAFLRGECEPGE